VKTSFRPAIAASVAGWLLAALLAVASGASSLGWMTRQASPSVASTMWPVNGFALAELADDLTNAPAAALTGRRPAAMPGELAEIARDAISAEPASAGAVRALALYHQSAGRDERALALMRLASSITRRDEVANLWLVNQELRAGRLDDALARYDVTLRTMGGRRGYVLAAMSAALSDAEMIPPFLRLLRARPPWSEEFWHVVTQAPLALDNAARLRAQLVRAGIPSSAEKDDLLLNALVEQQRFAAAFALNEALGRGGNGGLLQNADFSWAPGTSPLDWRLTSTGEMGAAVDTRAGALEISAAGGASGPVARQLARLEPGRYRLEVTLATASQSERTPLQIEISCAERGRSYPEQEIAIVARTSAQVDLSGAGCRYHWVSISVDASEVTDGFDLSVDEVRLTRL
jgi:hypothetical protein